MDTISFTAVGIILGGLITYFVSKYYYQKTVKQKSLTPFLQFISGILTDLDAEVKKKLSIKYDRRNVRDLYQAQFVIANTGDYPIRDCIQPLTLEVPENGEILDVDILHVEPAGRHISYQVTKSEQGPSRVSFHFPLLNSSEYFIAKLLVKGKIPSPPSGSDEKEPAQSNPRTLKTFHDVARDFKFSITVDDLPPTIVATRLPYQYEIERRTNRFDWGAVIGFAVMGLISFCLSYVLFSFSTLRPMLFIFNFEEFFSNLSPLSLAIIVAWVLAVIILTAGFALLIGELSHLRPATKPKFRIPSQLSKQHYRFLDIE